MDLKFLGGVWYPNHTMVFFPCRSCAQWQHQNRTLQLELNDLREHLSKREAAWTEERQKLVDRIIAVERPAVGMPLIRPVVARPIREHQARPVLNIPGHTPDLRPPVEKKN